eukprot:TRINITY_DN7792_c2_g1_i1.p1 TRINITY_DN7792_c2_g1~~TRINITY_DN7792_c2_g1_i1.p1  ORF type:complete len:111 (-),score=0.72 TRINITY_DN7792_c2_g1_i1:9-341(-)
MTPAQENHPVLFAQADKEQRCFELNYQNTTVLESEIDGHERFLPRASSYKLHKNSTPFFFFLLFPSFFLFLFFLFDILIKQTQCHSAKLVGGGGDAFLFFFRATVFREQP